MSNLCLVWATGIGAKKDAAETATSDPAIVKSGIVDGFPEEDVDVVGPWIDFE